jgi:hypothetical protein
MTTEPERKTLRTAIIRPKLDAALPPGTLILTLDGALPIEMLYAGDRVITRDAGAQRIRAIVRRKLPKNTRLVRICKDALGGKPGADISVLPQQRLIIRDWRAQALYGAKQAQIEAGRLIDGHHITWDDTLPTHMISLYFTEPRVVYAGGLELLCSAPEHHTIVPN